MDLSAICTNCFKFKGNEDVCPYCRKTSAPPPKEAYHLPAGTLLNNNYLLGQTLGYGGFGVIYKALDLKLGRIVAIKEYFPTSLASRVPGEKSLSIFSGKLHEQFFNGLKAFLHEAQVMASFDEHPNIVKVNSYFEENRTAYIEMEYLDGISLEEYLLRCSGKIPWEEAVDITLHVLDGLEHLHKNNIIHRDINPKNIFLTCDNKIKIIDFGSASFGENDEMCINHVVTPGYAPPEQFYSKSLQGYYTDIYALGATMYRAVTGKVPQNSTDRRKNDSIAKPSTVVKKLPQSVDIAIMKALAYKKDFRFKSCEEFRFALVDSKASYDYPEIEERKRNIRRIALAVAALLVFFACVVVTVSLTNRDKVFEKYGKNVEDGEKISVCIPFDTSRSNSEEIKNTYKIIENNFKDYSQKYYKKNIELSFIFIDPESYTEKIKTSDDLCLFMQNNYSEANVEKEDLSDFLELVKNDYAFYDKYKNYLSDVNLGCTAIPYGIEFGIICSKYNSGYKSWNDFSKVFANGKKVCVNEEDYPFLIESMIEENVSSSLAADILYSCVVESKSRKDASLYFSDQSPVFVGTTRQYSEIFSSDNINVSLSNVKTIGKNGNFYGRFCRFWSVSKNITDSKKNASVLFLKYMMSDDYQSDLVLPKEYISCNRKTIKSQKSTYDYFEDYIKNLSEINIIDNNSSQMKIADEFKELLERSNDLYEDIKSFSSKHFI